MAIVRMKRLRMLGLAENRERIMRLLSFVGVVEVSEVSEDGRFPFKESSAETAKLRENLSVINQAIETAKVFSEFKSGMFAPRIKVTEKELFSSRLMLEALDAAANLNEKKTQREALVAEKSKYASQKETLVPWKNLSVGLDVHGGRYFSSMQLTLPASVSMQDVETAVQEASALSEVFEVSSDKELHYLFLIAHNDSFDEVFQSLKRLGGAKVSFGGIKTTAKERMRELDGKIAELEVLEKQLGEELVISREVYDKLLTAQDALEAHLAISEASELGKLTERTFYIEGWCPAREEKTLAKFFRENGCAYEFADPEEGEEAPTLTHNVSFISPFETVTNMYSAPAYNGIDPNPTMGPFFAMFFGIMFSDAGYGLILMLAGIFALIKLSPRGGFRNFMKLAVMCGATTVFWGLMFGGFFGNAIPAVYELVTGEACPFTTALWFDPTTDPMSMLIFSLVCGGIQIIASMAVKGYMMIRDGQVLDAIFDIGFWWLAFAGAIVSFTVDSQIGLYILLAGVLGLILTQGRAKKNIIMKLLGGVMSLYDVTGYFSDMLSYSRLLALSLATAVVGTVINTMGVLTGPIGFVIVFLIGHVFNIAINLVGSFVHSARLQYVEYFGRFYESGGRLFSPLAIRTKNTDIIKEEN